MEATVETYEIEKKQLPQWCIEALRTLGITTAIIVVAILMFYKGMIYQCNELDMEAWAVEEGWIGFECKEKQEVKEEWKPTYQEPGIDLDALQNLQPTP